jgi:regulator of cell morphogenesis and NO signaling
MTNPTFKDVVREIFQDMKNKVQSSEEVDLDPDFEQLRMVTDNYEVPSDGCEAYTTTYEMLEEADKAYHAS